MPFIDFAALKSSMTIEDAVSLLGLEMKPSGQQLRGACPACNSADRTLVVTPSKGAFYCFGSKAGGDLIALAAHIKGVSVKDAAVFLAGGTVKASTTSTVKVAQSVPAAPAAPASAAPQAPAQPAAQENALEKIAARLLFTHPEVQALGLSPERAEELGIGYDKRGVLRGRVLIPLHVDGELAGFVGFAKDLEPILKFPSQLTEVPENVVPLKKKA